ncbi:MAG: hypothetical protein JSR46_05545 [Verrucomicrobia bacterium]|nr:hypothetical protein [Verrucomicrobiota bacterium]
MDFNKAITNVNDFDGSFLWAWAEGYLDVGSDAYEIKDLKEATCIVEASQTERNDVATILKVVSYASIIFPLIALGIKAAYRSQHNFEMVKHDQARPNFPVAPRVERAIASFKADFEKERKEDTSDNPFRKAGKLEAQNIDYAAAAKALDSYLADYPTYTASMEKVFEIVYMALHTLAKDSSKESLAHAKQVYKKMGAFLRKNTNQDYLEIYKRHLYREKLSRTDQDYLDCSGPEVYLLRQHKEESLYLPATIFVAKQLRKRAKLEGKYEKVISRVNQKLVPADLISRAMTYLNISWLHGTKAFALKSACEYSDKEILPSVELKQRKVALLTGEMREGSCAIGINGRAISGVNLPSAEKSIFYANLYSFDLENEVETYNRFLASTFTMFYDLLDRGELTRQIEALSRVKRYDRERFEKDKPLLILKKEQIYKTIKKEVIDSRPNKIYSHHDDYYTSKFYVFLESLARFEQLLTEEGQVATPEADLVNAELAKIGVVIASRTKCGAPVGFCSYDTEEVRYGALKLGDDIQAAFVKDEQLPRMKELLTTYGLHNSIEVESIEVLETASKIDQALGSYFNDVYNMKKWQKAIKKDFEEANTYSYFTVKGNKRAGRKIEITIPIARCGDLTLTEANLAEICRRASGTTLNTQYLFDDTSIHIDGKTVHRPNHNGTHSTKQLRHIEALFDLIEKRGLGSAKKILGTFTQAEKSNLKLAAYLLRSGRVDESRFVDKPADDYYTRSAIIYEAYAKQLGVSKSLIEWTRSMIIDACKPESACKQAFKDKKSTFAYTLLTTAHELDLVRCFDREMMRGRKKDNQNRLELLVDDPKRHLKTLYEYAKALCTATGSSRAADGGKMDEPLFAKCSLEGDFCLQQVRNVPLPIW